MLIQSMLLAIILASAQCTFRNWIVNTNKTLDSRYWDSLVTIGSYTFNGSMTHGVAMPKMGDESEDEFCELIYPLDKLPPASVELANTTVEGECVDEELVKKMDRVFWLDPRNWRSVYSVMYTFSPQTSEVVPHIERVPCDHDGVGVPNTTSTFIILPPNPVTLTMFRFGNTFLYYHSLRSQQIADAFFMRHFITKSNVELADMFNITGVRGCEDRTGCTCGTARYQNEICAFVVDDCPKNLPCDGPIKPIGHCCFICGARVSVRFNKETFIYAKLEKVVDKFIKTETKKLNYDVDMYMSKVSEYRVQIVMTPKNEYSAELLNDLAEGLASYLNKPSNLGIEVSYAVMSGRAKVDQHVWSTVGIILTGSALALTLGFFLVYVKKQKWFDSAGKPKSTHLEGDGNQHDESTESKYENDANDAHQNGKNIDIEPLPELQQPVNFIDTSD